MSNAYYGKLILGELSDAQALPNNGSADSDNMVYVGGKTNGRLWINVYANTDISIADTKSLFIDIETWTSDAASSAIAPFSSGGTAISGATYRILNLTASGAAVTFSAGDLIVQVAVPEDLMNQFSTPHTYIQIKYTTTDNESSEKVDAFVYAKI